MISVIIPVKNGADTLERCLKSLRNQTIGNDLEIIILDSMSIDNSRDLAKKFGAIIIPIPNGTFNHGLTRNIGAQQATYNILYYTVQDAWIEEPDMLQRMLVHFDNEDIASVCGHQAVFKASNTNPVFWFKRFSEPVPELKHFQNSDSFNLLSINDKMRHSAWDDVVAAYRKSALLQQPFVQTEFGEDFVWAYQALQKGWAIIYDPSIVVYHYHHQNFTFAFRIDFILNYHRFYFYNKIPEIHPLFIPIIKYTWHLFKNKHLKLLEKLFWILNNYSILFGRFFSTIFFRFILMIGGKAGINKAYEKICKVVPQGLQKRVV